MQKDTKATLLKVTRKLIDKHGINTLSMRTVGKQAGLSRTALYRHFENKESLLVAIVIENFTAFDQIIKTLQEQIKDPRELLYRLFIAYYHYGIDNPDHYQLMFNTNWDKNKYPKLRESAFNIFEDAANMIISAMPTKPIDSKIVLEKTAILYSFIHGLVELHLAGHNEVSKGLNNIEQLIAHELDVHLKQ